MSPSLKASGELFRCRLLLPISSPPVEDAAFIADNGILLAVGPWKDLRKDWTGSITDLQERVVLPGLVNPHVHLEYTDMLGELPSQQGFTNWVDQMVQLKRSWEPVQYQRSWLKGLEQQIPCGTTTLADTLSHHALLGCMAKPPRGPRLKILLEWIHTQDAPLPSSSMDRMQQTLTLADQWSDGLAGSSPHAPYTTTPSLWEALGNLPQSPERICSVHLAESAEEISYFQDANGPLFDWLSRAGIQNTWGQGHPIRLLDRSQLIPQGMLAIHANILEARDIQILASHRATMVHCPRSHAFFDHPPFPLHDCLQAGIPVALGTDSLATIKKPAPIHPFHLFHEAKEALKQFPTLRPSTALGMITFQAAKVLGLEKKVGSLAPGMACDWISTPYGGTPEDAAASIIESIPEWDHVVSAGQPFPLEAFE